MTDETTKYLDADDLAMIEMLRTKNLSAAELQAAIDDIQREAFKRNRNSLMDKPPQRFDIQGHSPAGLSNLSTTPKVKPPGWDESMARVKAQLETNRLYAPIEGTNNSPFYAAEQREAAERKRVEEWKARKEKEISLTRENRIKREIAEYTNAKGLEAKKAAMERLSPEALARVANRGGV